MFSTRRKEEIEDIHLQIEGQEPQKEENITISTPTPISKTDFNWIIGILLLALTLTSLDQGVVTVALPSIIQDLNAVELFGWLVSGYLLTAASFSPLYGKIFNIYGRKKLLQFAIWTFCLGSIWCGVAQNMWWLISGRMIQGIGCAGIISLTFIVIVDLVPPLERGKYNGILGLSFVVGLVGGPVLGGALSESKLGWRSIFFINIPICILCSFIIYKKMPKSTYSSSSFLQKIDYLGSCFLCLGTICLLLGLTWGNEQNSQGWSNWYTIFVLVLSFLSFLLFIFQEQKVKEQAIIPLHLFQLPNFSLPLFIHIVNGIPLFGIISYLPLFFQIVLHVSGTMAGVYMIPCMVVIIVAGGISGTSISKKGSKYKLWIVIPLFLQILGLGLFVLITSTTNTSYGFIFIFLCLLAIGAGCVVPTLQLIIQAAPSLKEEQTIASSVASFSRELGGCIGVGIFQTIFNCIYQQQLSLHGLNASLIVDYGVEQIYEDVNKDLILASYTYSFHVLFAIASTLTGFLFILSCFIKNKSF